MRLHVVSDVHGNSAALARAGDGADAVICLGDLLNFVDYSDYGAGIMGELFGAAAVAEFVSLRTARRFTEAGAHTRALWAGLADPRAAIDEQIERQYAELFAAMPVPAYLTYGNVDVPQRWAAHLRPGMQVLDGEVIELGDRRFGFVGGGLPTPMRTPYEVPEPEFAAKVAALGQVDVVCSHIPPAVPELTYDVRARRFERGSEALLDLIHQTQPSLVLFGHVHQPLQHRIRIGRTECINVGHFRSTARPFVL